MDNASDHRAPVVRTWWDDQDGRITPVWLPVSSPHLNLIERVWRFLKEQTACHRFWNGVSALETRAATPRDHIEAHFHTPNGPAIRLVNNFCSSA